jgi:hypothetical protein
MSFLLLAISCKKDQNPTQRTGDGQVRIYKVERNSDTYKGAPFFNDNSGAVLYEYDNTGRLKIIKVYTDHSYQQASQILEYTVNHLGGIGNSCIELIRKELSQYDPLESFFVEELRIAFSNSKFDSSFYKTKIKQFNGLYGYSYENMFSTKYSDPPVSESCNESFAEFDKSDPESHGKYIRSNCFRTDASGKLTSIYKSGVMYRFATSEFLDADKYSLVETFEYYNGDITVPKGLIKFVNSAIFGIYNFGMEESSNLFSIVTVGSPPQNIYNHTAFQDWIFSFGLPQALGNDSNLLIKSKRIQGEKNIGFEGFEDTYIFKDIDSTANYPYTHDPIAKTLEIAGLKIWYEVVE